jgi:tetratricopeptide (TPR) repeat protein
MNRAFTYFLAVLLALFFTNLQAQNRQADSLRQLLSQTHSDSSRCRLMNNLAWKLKSLAEYKEAASISEKALRLAREKNYPRQEAFALNALGSIASDEGRYGEALSHYGKTFKIYESLNDSDGMAVVFGNIGTVLTNQGNYPMALQNYLNALNLYERTGNRKGISMMLGNVGTVYYSNGEYVNALGYYAKALKLRKRERDVEGMVSIESNMATLYQELARREKNPARKDSLFSIAIEMCRRALKECERLGLQEGIPLNLGNLGLMYEELGENDKALDCYRKALQMNEEIGDKASTAINLGNIGVLYLSQGKRAEGTAYLKKALAISEEIGDKDGCKDWHLDLSNADSARGDIRSALQHYKMHIAYKDSILNEENTRKIVQQQMQYDFDKKEALMTEEQKRAEARTEAENLKQTLLLSFAAIVAAGLGVIAVMVLRSLRITRRQKKAIEQQKMIIDEKQKEILDSIRYAGRIQRSLLPSESYIARKLSEGNLRQKLK